MTFTLRSNVLRMPFRDPFRIARPEDHEAATTVINQLELDGSIGSGEAFPVPYYGETVETIAVVQARLIDALDDLGSVPRSREAALLWLERSARLMGDSIGGHGGARMGLDIALHDLAGQALGLPIHELIGTSADLPPTDYTLGIDDPETVAQRARAVAHFPALKIKLGGPSDIETLEAVRAVFSGPLRVDANTGWEPEAAVALIPELARLGVELIEQPFPATHLPQSRWLQERSSLPIMLDESAVFEDDLIPLEGAVAGVVVKLGKCGGIGPALRMIRRAHGMGLKVMLGCMVESTLGIAAAAAVAAEVDWLDLDGNLLLAEDPFVGLELDETCRWRLPETPGVGVTPRPS